MKRFHPPAVPHLLDPPQRWWAYMSAVPDVPGVGVRGNLPRAEFQTRNEDVDHLESESPVLEQFVAAGSVQKLKR